MKRHLRRLATLALLSGMALPTAPVAYGARTGPPTMPTAVPGYQIAVFATGAASYAKPDAIVADGAHLYVGYQNNSSKTGSTSAPSTIVEYTMQGARVRTFSVPGHTDGLRVDPATHDLWVTSNEDANPTLTIISPASGALTTTPLKPTPHQGGYDDLAFLNGMVFVAASNPTLDKAGVNTAPAIARITIQGSTPTLTPVLAGNAVALDLTTMQHAALNVTDPDSLSVDPQGDLVLVDQAGAELIFVQHPGTARQRVSRLPVGTQLDDTVWATATRGRLFVVDGTSNVIWSVEASFKPGTVYTEAPSDSGVAGFVGTISMKTGVVTPVIIGLVHPTGLLFVPGM